MAFNVELLKKHPYATGGAVLVGAIILYIIIKGSQGSSGNTAATTTATSGDGTTAADVQMAQIQAAADVQSNAQQVALQTAQLQANVADTQTAASLQATQLGDTLSAAAQIYGLQANVSENATNVAGATTQQANQLLYAQNIQQMQDNVLEDQIGQAASENENNNATALAGEQIQANYGVNIANLQAGVASQSIADESTYAENQLSDTNTLVSGQAQNYDNVEAYILGHAGEQKNSALDATDQTNLFQTILSGGNPGVASAGVQGTTQTAVSGNNSGVATVSNAINSTIGLIGAGLFA
jgi:hypothetical protein